MDNRNRVNQVIGKTYGFWGIPPTQVLYLGGLAIVLFPIFLFDKPLYFLILVSFFIGWVIVSGEKPGKFWEKAHTPRKWASCNPGTRITKAGLPAPLFPKNPFFIHRKKKFWYTEMQHKEFMTFFDFQIDTLPAGAYVLHRKTEAMFIFGWRYRGHDSMAIVQEVQNKLNGMFYGVTGLQNHINLKAYQSSFLGDSGAIEQYEQLTKKPGLTYLERCLIASGIKRVQDMTDEDSFIRQNYGNMQDQESLIYAKVRVQFGSPPSQNPSALEKFLSAMSAAFGLGVTNPDVAHWNKAAFSAYESFTQVNKVLRNSTGFGFKAEVLSAEQLFETDYKELHPNSEVPLIPQKVVVTRQGIQLPEFNTDTHILGVLSDPESGYAPTIQASRSYVFLPTMGENGKYAGFVRVGGKGKISSFPSIDGDADLGLYLFWQNIIGRRNDVLYDYKIVWEYVIDDSRMEEVNLERTIKGAVGQQTAAIQHKTINVTAQMLQEEAAEARESLEGQDKIGFLSIGVWLYRNTTDELFSAMNSLVQNMPTTNSEIAMEICEYIWHQTAPYTWQAFVTEPGCSRIKYLAEREAIPQLPFLSPQSLDPRGSLFLHEQFRTPIYLDFWHKSPNHIALIGETGGSKSVVTFGLIFEGNIYSYPSIIFEFPRSDGRSTYTDLLRLLKAQGKKVAYVDVRRSKINIIERPSFSHINTSTPKGKKKLQDAIEGIEDAQCALLVSVILGVSQHPDQDTIESWVYRAFRAFLNDSTIADRYDRAVYAGFGNPGFEQMPGLPDFVAFACGSIQINADEEEEIVPGWFQRQIDKDKLLYDGSKKAIDFITNSLRGVLDTPLGRSISGPSSFSLEEADCVVLSLTNVSGNRESLVYAQTGLQLILRKAIASNHSACFVEELTTLYMMPAFARQIASLPPTARKQGMNCAFIFQSIAEPFATTYGAAIFNNLQKIFLLKATEGIVSEVVQHLKFREKIAKDYIGNTISKEILESRLCVRQGNQYIPLTHNPSPLLLSLAATDTDEVAARIRCEMLYGDPNDESNIDWLLLFAELYADALRSGASMDSILPKNWV